MADVARVAGVSKNTVSLALRQDPQIPERTRKRITAIAHQMGYQKNATVAQLLTELRRTRRPRFQASLALLNANADRNAFRDHPTVPTYVEGCRRLAEKLGYGLDEFWLHDPELDGARLNQVLRARGIRGVLVVGLMSENVLPTGFAETWATFPSVVTGARTRDPALSFACADHHILTVRAFEKALALGYRRPALVLDRAIDVLVEGRFSAGFAVAARNLPITSRVRPFYSVREALGDCDLFRKWFAKEKPDVLLTLYNVVRTWLDEMGVRVPADVGLIQLEWRASSPEWAGMDQHNDIVGEAAVEMLVSMTHRQETGVPAFPRATLIGSTWVDGDTVRNLNRTA
jgi:DNA-binding LacI/PurR family transcriptional regulator